jgi:hypothetical protein
MNDHSEKVIPLGWPKDFKLNFASCRDWRRKIGHKKPLRRALRAME